MILRKTVLLFCLGIMFHLNAVFAYSAAYMPADVETVIESVGEGERVVLEGKLIAGAGKEDSYTFADETGVITVEIDAARFRIYKAEIGRSIQIFGIYKIVNHVDKIAVERMEML